jgi:hypothetical protein
MRTRLLRPEFWSDELMASLPRDVRLVYMGLWNLADDAGYLERRPRAIAAALFPYDGMAEREALIDGALELLVREGRVLYLECPIHARIPTLPRHAAKGGTKATTFESRHRTTCLSERVRTGPDKSRSGYGSDSGSGSDSDSESAGAQARLGDAAAAAGGFVADLEAHRSRRAKA